MTENNQTKSPVVSPCTRHVEVILGHSSKQQCPMELSQHDPWKCLKEFHPNSKVKGQNVSKFRWRTSKIKTRLPWKIKKNRL